MKYKLAFLLIISSLLLTTSCSKYQKLLKSTDNELKYNKAIEFYEAGKYYKAQQLFDQIIVVYRGTDKAEVISYDYANCYYEQGDYILAGYYFRTFSTTFPLSKYAEEAAYRSAYCSYLESPRSSLDQSSTKDAINSLQLFINQYPGSDKVENCNALIDELRAKLEKKAIDIALLYYRMEDYKAAIVSFGNILKEYPSTSMKEDVVYYLAQSNEQLAVNSIESKKQERIQNAIEACDRYLSEFAEGKYKSEVISMKQSLQEIVK